MFPPSPSFVEKDIPDLTGKNAAVYIAARSAEKGQNAIAQILSFAEGSGSRGRLAFLGLDLSDLRTIKPSACKFLKNEERLNFVIYNAGVMTLPPGSKTGHDFKMGTNALDPFLFNSFLLPLLKRTAATSPPESVRVVWVASIIDYNVAQGGIVSDGRTGAPKVRKNQIKTTWRAKRPNFFRDAHLGLMKTELQRHRSSVVGNIMGAVLKGPSYGAYTELFAAISSKVTASANGSYIIPWGRFGTVPKHIEKGMRLTGNGGTGLAERFWT
ncbi:hypothetical protein BJX70DRAFT_392648 [Aspergillus crustosus]